MDINSNIKYDVFLSHSHNDAEQIEYIAEILEDEYNLKVWLDKWILIPGEKFIQAMSKGLDEANTCAVFVGSSTPRGWFKEEIDKALNKQNGNKSFRVIPVLLPESNPSFLNDFLELRTWAKFVDDLNDKRSIHELVCGIQGIPPGRSFLNERKTNIEIKLKDKLKKVNDLHKQQLIEESIKLEYQRKILEKLIKLDEKGL